MRLPCCNGSEVGKKLPALSAFARFLSVRAAEFLVDAELTSGNVQRVGEPLLLMLCWTSDRPQRKNIPNLAF
jgi:hypothetical protein